jgi:hypothetical protein
MVKHTGGIAMHHATQVLIDSLIPSVRLVQEAWNEKWSDPIPEIQVDGFTGDNRNQCDDSRFNEFNARLAYRIMRIEYVTEAMQYGMDAISANKAFKAWYNDLLKPEKNATLIEKRNRYLENARDMVANYALATKLAKDGLHELTVSPEQALGMADMKFSLTTDEFLMPVDSMVVHIPQTLFKLDRFAQNMPGMEKALLSDIRGVPISSMFIDKVTKATHKFIKNGEAISILVQKFNGNQKAVSLRMFIGEQNWNMVANTNLNSGEKTPIEFCLQQQDSSPPLVLDLYRIALSACLISTVKAGMCIDREIPSGVQKERNRFFDRISPVIKIEKKTYFIFQPNMKTYKEEGVAGESDRKSPESYTIRPIFVSGHMRRQPYGPKRSLRRIQWIKAIIRNKRLLINPDAPIVTHSDFTQPNEVIEAIKKTLE